MDRIVKERKTWFSFLVNSSEEFQMEFFKAITREFLGTTDERKITQRAKELETIFYATLKVFYETAQKGLTWRFSSSKDINTETLRRKITEFRIKSVKKQKHIPKRNEPKLYKLKPFLPVIMELRQKGLSYPEVIEYLKRYHKIEVSVSGLKKFLKQMSETGGSAPKTPAKGAQ